MSFQAENALFDLTRSVASRQLVYYIETVTLEVYIKSDSDVESHQFGFKGGHSTALCTNVLKQTVDYNTNRGNYVFACFIDFQTDVDWQLM